MKNRKTKQKTLILEAVKNSKIHPTAEIVYEAVKKEIPEISLGTVYRNLENLAHNGEIKKIQLQNERQMRFDGDLTKHIHLKCKTCNNLYDLFLDIDVSKLINKDNSLDFNVEDFNLELIGYCKKCKTGGKND